MRRKRLRDTSSSSSMIEQHGYLFKTLSIDCKSDQESSPKSSSDASDGSFVSCSQRSSDPSSKRDTVTDFDPIILPLSFLSSRCCCCSRSWLSDHATSASPSLTPTVWLSSLARRLSPSRRAQPCVPRLPLTVILTSENYLSLPANSHLTRRQTNTCT